MKSGRKFTVDFTVDFNCQKFYQIAIDKISC